MIGFVSSGSGFVRSKYRSEVCQVRSENRLRKFRAAVRMSASEEEKDSSDEGEKTFPLLKDFLAGLNDLGHLRIIGKSVEEDMGDATCGLYASPTSSVFVWETLPNTSVEHPKKKTLWSFLLTFISCTIRCVSLGSEK